MGGAGCLEVRASAFFKVCKEIGAFSPQLSLGCYEKARGLFREGVKDIGGFLMAGMGDEVRCVQSHLELRVQVLTDGDLEGGGTLLGNTPQHLTSSHSSLFLGISPVGSLQWESRICLTRKGAERPALRSSWG